MKIIQTGFMLFAAFAIAVIAYAQFDLWSERQAEKESLQRAASVIQHCRLMAELGKRGTGC